MYKHLLLDALSLVDEKPKGAQVYIFNLLKQFSVINNDFKYTVFIRAGKSDYGLPKTSQISYEKIKASHVSLWQLLKLPQYLKNRNFDLLHFMADDSVLGNISVPYVITVNESLKKYYKYTENKIGILDFKKRMAKISRLSLRQKMIENAKGIIAISNSTKKDLISDYRLPEDKIKVIYWACDESFFNYGDKIYDTPYILIFATGDRRENVYCELRAFKRIKNQINHYLFIAGIPDMKFQKKLENLCLELEILDRIKFFSFLTGNRLKSIYKNADLYIDMSFFEGFGLQVLEAMASRIPVITSNVDSLPEVVGDAGVFVNPDDDKSLAEAIMNILKNDEKKRKMREASYLRAQEFSWRKTAQETLKVYEKILCQKF